MVRPMMRGGNAEAFGKADSAPNQRIASDDQTRQTHKQKEIVEQGLAFAQEGGAGRSEDRSAHGP